MGGNALKKVKTVRLDKRRHEETAREILSFFEEMGVKADVPKSYATKESFGDLDVVVENRGDMDRIVREVLERFFPKETFKNKTIFSFAYALGKEEFFQVDLIFVPPRNFESSLFYLSYNDLSNILGRIARRIGLKFGHEGLFYIYKNEREEKIGEILVTKEPGEIYEILGVSYERYLEGFGTLEEIFEFVVSSKYFAKETFHLKNLDCANRNRNRKRKTYMEFLDYLERKDFPSSPPDGEIGKRVLPSILEKYPHVGEKAREIEEKIEKKRAVSKKFNGRIVMEITGMRGKELKPLMRRLKERYGDDVWLSASDEEIRRIIEEEAKKAPFPSAQRPGEE